MFAFVVLALALLCTKPKDWLGRTSPKRHILRRVGLKVITQSTNQLTRS